MRKANHMTRSPLVLAIAAGMSLGVTGAAMAAPGAADLGADGARPVLFEGAPRDAAMPLPEGWSIKRERIVRMTDPSLLLDGDKNAVLSLNLFDDLILTASAERIFAEGVADFNWVGSVAQDEHAIMSIARVGDAIVGDISSPKYGDFKILPAGEGVFRIIQVDVEGLNPCGKSEAENLWWDPTASAFEPGKPLLPADHYRDMPSDAASFVDIRGTEPVTVDVLILWTPRAQLSTGSEAAMQAALANFINNTNTSYINSGIDQRVRLVHSQRTEYVEATGSSGTPMGTDLSRLRNNGDGIMDEAHTLRNQYGADLVHLVSGVANGACGIAYLLFPGGNSSNGFGVTAYSCGWSTFAHELGHNMGCAHDRDNGSSGYRCWSFGYRTPNAQWRTIMAYAPGTRINYFSSPDVTWNGFTMGIGTTACPSTTAADNVRTMNETRNVVANFRASTVGNPPPTDFSAVAPANNAVGVALSGFGIQWQPAQFVQTYEVIIATNPDMVDPIITAPGLTTNAWPVPPGTLQHGTRYYWSVIATGTGGQNTISPDPSTFVTRPYADQNGDGTVNFSDLNLVLSQFGQSGSSLIGDVNRDGTVNFSDINAVLSNFGNTPN